MATLRFELVAPDRVLYSGQVEAVLLPASEGDMTVLSGHEPTMTSLKTGFVVFTSQKNEGMRVLVRGGFAEINATGVTILAERATPVEEMTAEKIDREIDEARMLRDGSSDYDERVAADLLVAQLREARAALQF